VAAVVGVYFWLSPTRVVTTGEQPAVEYILDASPRMGLPAQGGDSGTRLSVAQGVLAEIVRPAKSDLTAGLRVFGTGVIPEACRDTELLVPLTQANQAEISNRLLALEVGGSADAAMAEAMVNAIRELDAVTGPHSLVVVTGGTDSCNPEAGALIADEAEKAGISLRLYVVGYQVPPEEAESLKGLIDESGGDYFDAQDAGDLESILKAIQNYIDNPQALTPMEFLGTPVAQGVTAQPLATGAAGDTPAPADTPAPEATPAEQPTQPEAQPTLGPTGDDIGAYQSQTACDHPYFPLREGATWTFSSESGPQTWTVTSVSGDETNATADMAIDMAEVSVTYHWTCSPEGIVSYDFGNISVPGAEGGGFTLHHGDDRRRRRAIDPIHEHGPANQHGRGRRGCGSASRQLSGGGGQHGQQHEHLDAGHRLDREREHQHLLPGLWRGPAALGVGQRRRCLHLGAAELLHPVRH
jgi:hypothetical protein